MSAVKPMAQHLVSAALALALLMPSAALSADDLKLSGDLRSRYEVDYDVTGKGRRQRLRYRFRLNAVHKAQTNLEIGARLTSGSPTDQQSPHQTLGDDFGKKDLSLDKAYVKYSFDGGWVWFGKNSFPFWRQNEMWWDGDVNPEGVSLSYTASAFAGGHVSLVAGHFVIDDFNGIFDSSLSAGQVRLSHGLDAATITVAAGYYFFNNEKSDASYNPLGGMDQGILVLSAQAKLKSSLPIALGVDLMSNTEDPAGPAFEDETKGFVAQVSIGKLKDPGSWMAAAYYARIEKYAVIPNFAQDDWWRFGSGHTDSSNLQGFEVRLGYQVAARANLILRHYLTEEIEGDKEASRFRVDLNTKF